MSEVLPVRAAVEMDAEFVLGIDAIPTGRVVALQDYLVQVVEQRGAPLHLNNLWNALYFRWDLDRGGYPVDAVSLDALEETRLGQVGPALPVGAFAYLPTDTAARELLGEVVAKYGAHPLPRQDLGVHGLLGDPDIPPELAGGAATSRTLTEQVVVDFAALPGWTDALTPVRLQRIRQRGVWLTELGHLRYDATYPNLNAADADDVSFYVEWLLTHRRDGLLAWAFDLHDEQLTSDELARALEATFATVEALADRATDLVRLGDQFWSRAALARYLDGPAGLGRDDVDAVGRVLTNTYGQPLRYAATGLELYGHVQDHYQTRLTDILGGLGWVSAVFATNRRLANRITETAHRGVVNRDDGPCLPRLDDLWQHAGLWRTERSDPSDLPWYASVPVDRPLGLGAGVPAPADLEDDQLLPTAPLRLIDADLSDELDVSWVATLSASGYRDGLLPVPPEAARYLPDGPATVRLTHVDGLDGVAVTRQYAWSVTARRSNDAIAGVGWPARLGVGTVLHCQMRRGSRVVDVSTRRLVSIDSVVHEHDHQMRSEAMHADPQVRRRRRLATAVSALLEQVAAAGRGMSMPLLALVEQLLGREATTRTEDVREMMDVVDDLGLRRRGLLVLAPSAPATAGRRVGPLDHATRQQLEPVVLLGQERMRLRQLHPEETPPDEDTYRQDREAAGETSTLPYQPPAGYTYERRRTVSHERHVLTSHEPDYFDSKDWT